MATNFTRRTSKVAWRPTKSFWIVSAIWLLFLIIAISTGGFGAWLVMFALFFVVTALYSLLSGRRSWLGLPHRKGAGGAIGGGVVALIIGAMLVPPAAVETSTIQPLVALPATTTSSASASPSPTPSPTPKYVLLEECFSGGQAVTELSVSYVCTLDDKGVLVWMTEKDSKVLVAQRADDKKRADEKIVAEKAAADKAVSDKVAADQLVAEQAAQQQAAAAQAAQVEADRVAAEQAAQQQAPAIQPLVQVPAEVPVEAPAAAYYPNCDAAKAAGAAPMYVGHPGYRPGLDRDKDGIACDK
ncbi:excalibur calcium-binding domain-containing protein [Arthrobacter psychrolactophilus]|nr:excalibur calcium-binding domain-containing protein [Arthrobacter psychrolactophilus]